MTALAVRQPSLANAVEGLFHGSYGAPRVGLERELIPFRHEDVTARVLIDDMRPALAGVPDVTFEPGGQVELSPAPSATATEAIAVLQERERAARAALAPAGIHLLAAGLDPWRGPARLGLQLHSERYRAMDAYFAARGPAGRRFMRQTAGLQVCVDLRPGRDGVVQWRAAHLIAPVLAAMFANSRVCEGRRLSTDGGRTAVCLATDPSRMAFGRLGTSADPVGEYLRFAGAAPPLSPGLAGVDAHLTTLFPAVRPRGAYLEVRAMDSVPGADLPAAVALTVALLGVPGACDALVADLHDIDLHRLWEFAAGPGLTHPMLRGLAAALVRIATEAAGDLPCGYLPAAGLDRLVTWRAP